MSCSSPGEILEWDGLAWVCGADDDTTRTETEVDGCVANNGFVTAESDPTVNALGNADLSACVDGGT